MNLIPPKPLPPLRQGDRLTVAEFEPRYQAMPGLKKAELIDGVVYVGSPVSQRHSSAHAMLVCWVGVYAAETPHTHPHVDGTVRLPLGENMPQPDVVLRISPECGGRAKTGKDRYLHGGPEFVGEVSASSASYDSHQKLAAYRENRVQEYLIWRVEDEAIDWFALKRGQYGPLPRSAEGLCRSAVFPGLWLDTVALLKGDLARVLDVLREGLASDEHAAIVAKLAAKRKR